MLQRRVSQEIRLFGLLQFRAPKRRLYGVTLATWQAARVGFIEAHDTPNRGWIRTPSIVLSWSEADEMWVGGHNLDARALRIEEVAGITRPEIVEQAIVAIFRVPPAMGAATRVNANPIARMIEHGKVADPTILASRLAAFKPIAPRPGRQRR